MTNTKLHFEETGLTTSEVHINRTFRPYELLAKKISGLYVSFDKTFEDFMRDLHEANFDTKSIDYAMENAYEQE